MLSGRRLDLLDPSPLDIELSDIAHGLARVARWNGQTAGPHAFSVAQHCVVVEEIFRRLNKASPADRLIALLHDAPEYVIGDMISPFKAVVGGGYKTVEKRIEAAIHLRFGLPASATAALTEKIKKADRVAAFFEATLRRDFLPRKPPASLAGHAPSRRRCCRWRRCPRPKPRPCSPSVFTRSTRNALPLRHAQDSHAPAPRHEKETHMGLIVVSPLARIAEMAGAIAAAAMLSLMGAQQHFHRPACIPESVTCCWRSTTSSSPPAR